MMNEDPWSDIPLPNTVAALSARRVDADLRWDFFWARDVDRRCLLILNHERDSSPRLRLPKIKEIDVLMVHDEDSQQQTLSLKLMDSGHRDLFYRLCMDIIEATANANSEEEAVQLALSRTWRWHHLLRGGGEGHLSPEEQKGLIGELFVLEQFLLPQLPPADSLSAWGGPHGNPKDFEIGRTAIEAKARRGAARPSITISSEYQLDDNGVDTLFLHVAELDRVPVDADTGFTLTDVADRVGQTMRIIDEGAMELFDSLLISAGFDWSDDYSSWRWIEGPSRIYCVISEFPRITLQNVKAGVVDVRYSISLVECEPFLVDSSALVDAIRRQLHGD